MLKHQISSPSSAQDTLSIFRSLSVMVKLPLLLSEEVSELAGEDNGQHVGLRISTLLQHCKPLIVKWKNLLCTIQHQPQVIKPHNYCSLICLQCLQPYPPSFTKRQGRQREGKLHSRHQSRDHIERDRATIQRSHRKSHRLICPNDAAQQAQLWKSARTPKSFEDLPKKGIPLSPYDLQKYVRTVLINQFRDPGRMPKWIPTPSVRVAPEWILANAQRHVLLVPEISSQAACSSTDNCRPTQMQEPTHDNPHVFLLFPRFRVSKSNSQILGVNQGPGDLQPIIYWKHRVMSSGVASSAVLTNTGVRTSDMKQLEPVWSVRFSISTRKVQLMERFHEKCCFSGLSSNQGHGWKAYSCTNLLVWFI